MFENLLKSFLFAKREFKERYVGTSLGQFWYLLSPLVMIFIYTVIFSDFMKMKLNIIDNSYSYSIYLISGLFAWTSFSTIIMRLNTIFFEKGSPHPRKDKTFPIFIPFYWIKVVFLEVEVPFLNFGNYSLLGPLRQIYSFFGWIWYSFQPQIKPGHIFLNYS